MAMIHVNRGATSLGAFPEEQVREGLRAGRFVGTDLGWREGMTNWQPLSQFAEFAGDISPGGAAPPPQQATVTPAIATIASTGGGTARSGLPWDERNAKGLFAAFIETLQLVLTKPSEAFALMKREGGFGEPIIYALIGGCVGGVVSFLFSLGFQSMGLFANRQSTLGMMAGMGVGSAAFLILLPVMIVICLFIGAGIIHLCLILVGGAKQSFETTFRVIAFSQGSTGPLQMVPICGGLIACVWALVVNCIGLARAHETDTGRAALAVLLPLIVCCGFGIFAALTIPALIHMQNR